MIMTSAGVPSAEEATTAASVPFYSFSREFDLRYVFADSILLVAYVSWIWRSGWRWPLVRGLVVGAICYCVDAVVWYNTPLSHFEDGGAGDDGTSAQFQRTWEFVCSNGVALGRPPLERPSGGESCELFGFAMDPHEAYWTLKAMCDFMMTWSYALVWFTWESIAMCIWIEGNGGGSGLSGCSIVWHSVVAFTVAFLVYPLSLLLPMGGRVHAVATRHMHDEERGWFVYAAVMNALLLLYSVAWKGKPVRYALRDTLFCWTSGCFQAFGMVAPLYLFGIRPVFELSRLLYEVAFLINRGSAEHFLGCWIAMSFRRQPRNEKIKAA